MKKLFFLTLVLLTTSCFPGADVITGKFEVERTFVKTDVNNPNTCGSEKEIGEANWQTWVIKRHNMWDYSLSIIDDSGIEIEIAKSNDGYNFSGSATSIILGCKFTSSWEINLNYNSDRFTGTQTDTLILSCASGSCVDHWNIVGDQI